MAFFPLLCFLLFTDFAFRFIFLPNERGQKQHVKLIRQFAQLPAELLVLQTFDDQTKYMIVKTIFIVINEKRFEQETKNIIYEERNTKNV